MKILDRQKIQQIHLMAGDSLQVTYRDKETGEVVLADCAITADQAMTVDEAILFEGEFEGRRTLGGMVVERA
jgi:hypothetical protein